MKNSFITRGDTTTIILLNKGGSEIETLVTTSDLDKLHEFPGRWYAKWDDSTNSYYVVGNQGNSRTKKTLIHRYILDCPQDLVVDHINHNTLDNTRSNLRIATKSINQHNRRLNKNSSSGVTGVTWYKQTGKWQARIKINGQETHLGYYDDIENAKLMVDKARGNVLVRGSQNVG